MDTPLIRVRNNAGVGFRRVRATFPDGTKIDYGPVEAGKNSNDRQVDEAYSSTYLQTRLPDGRELTYQPGDDVERPLPPGRYTYVLTIEGRGSDAGINVWRLEADQ